MDFEASQRYPSLFRQLFRYICEGGGEFYDSLRIAERYDFS